MILPSPDSPFVWRHLGAGAALVCEPLEPLAPHFFTTRQWHLGSPGDGGDEWGQLAGEIGVGPAQLRRMKQVHGCGIAVAVDTVEPPTADILLTADARLAIAVQTADCVPLLLADPRSGAVAAAHAGWRGMVARVPMVVVKAMSERFAARPDDLIVAIGPSIGACCYEVGRDVHDAFAAAGHSPRSLGRWFAASPAVSPRNPPLPGRTLVPRSGHWFFDGWQVVRDQLQEAGVGANRMFASGLCTGSHPGAFCSYRRDGAPAGRMAGVIKMEARAVSREP